MKFVVVEMVVTLDFIADLGPGGVNPRIGHVVHDHHV